MTRRAKGRAARLARFEREQTIVGFLNRGVSIPEIAAKTGVGEKRMRAAVREILFRRMPKGPEEFAAIQASRLNEALLVAFSAMTDLNLQAVAGWSGSCANSTATTALSPPPPARRLCAQGPRRSRLPPTPRSPSAPPPGSAASRSARKRLPPVCPARPQTIPSS